MDYWKECISEAFDAAGIVATDDQIGEVASWVEGAHDNYGMAHGYDCIRHPSLDEVDQLKMRIAKMEQAHDRQLQGIREGVARRRGVMPQDVEIDEAGLVTYRP